MNFYKEAAMQHCSTIRLCKYNLIFPCVEAFKEIDGYILQGVLDILELL